MKKYFLITIFIYVVIISKSMVCYAQIIDFEKENSYQKVFIETDNFGASYLKILENALDKVKNDTIQFSILNDLAYYWHTRNLTKALAFTNKGLDLTLKQKDTLWQGRFHITQGAILLRMEKLDSAYLVLQKAKNMVKEADLTFLNTQLGYVFERRGQIAKAADYALISLSLGTKLFDKKAIAVAYSDLSNLFWKQSKFDKGLEYGLKSVKLFEERGLNDLDYNFTLYVVGNNYLALKNYEKALSFYEHAIVIGERYGFYNNLSDIYISLANLYAHLNDYDKATEAGNSAVKYASLLDNNFMLMRSWLSIGKLQNLQGKYISAIESLQKSITIATKDFGDEYYLSQAYEALGKALAGNHNYKDAYAAFAEYDQLKSKIFTVEADHRISLLQTELEVAQKEDTIQLQGLKIERQQFRQTLIIIFSSLLLIVLVILYKTYQNNRKKSRLLQDQNLEKEFLLKEIHHRVKNNLGIVNSLLALQTTYIDDANVMVAMEECQNRVYSMSLIHQRLYQGKNIAAVNMKDYFIDLGKHIKDSFGAQDRIDFTYDMKPIELDIDTAIPLGLIVNELLTNCLKHAFPDKRNGNIKIGLQKIDANTLELEVLDDGIGKGDNVIRPTGFGTQLIDLLLQQLEGTIKYDQVEGTSISMEFKIGTAA